MELPIDHFRLLGVSSSAEAEEILRVFQLRLDRAPDKGFTNDVLAQRAELLRLSADLLTDKYQRQEYENALSLGASCLELSPSREIAGLILLWESKLSLEAFKLSKKLLQPPQTPALGSGREADLALIAALSCRDAAILKQDQRHYASAADLLQEGIHLLQRMGKLTELRTDLEEDLELLLPFRILDLLSRNQEEQKSHQEGINLLDVFVTKRGGLEGRTRNKNFGGLTQSDFELFFQQIRNFLDAKEQIDLFSNWYRQGSQDAGFLTAISLVASGFVFKKPQNLQEARKYLKNLNYQGLDPMPLIGCIDLLLGDLKQAEARFKSSGDINLKDWLASYPGEDLAAYCHYCRDWLFNDVLHGFRDIKDYVPDLDNWFNDKYVQDYLIQIENKGARGLAKAGRSLISSLKTEKIDLDEGFENVEQETSLPMPGGVKDLDNQIYSSKRDLNLDFEEKEKLTIRFLELVKSQIKKINSYDFKYIFEKKPILSNLIIFIILFTSGSAIGTLSLIYNKNYQNTKNSEDLIDSKPKNEQKIDIINLKENKLINITKENKINQNKQAIIENKDIKFDYLKVPNPSESQIRYLIEKWLNGKAKVLANKGEDDFSKYAINSLKDRVYKEREKDKRLGETQIIKTTINSIKIESITNRRISAKVNINYEDKRLNKDGEIISETIIPSLNNQYVIGKEKDYWQLVDYVSGI